MKLLTVSIVALAICALSVPTATAQSQDKGHKGKRGEMREKMLKKFDKDGDGKLSTEERAAAREAGQKRRGKADKGGSDAKKGPRGQHGPRMNRKEMLKKFDKDGDGKLGPQEREAMMEAMLLKRFDKDGDGKLNSDEKAALEKAKAKMKQRREEMLKKYDKDGDGKISKDEMAQMREDRAKRGGQGQRKRKGQEKKADAPK